MAGRSELTLQIPSQGWSQFLTARKEMLDAFDSARAKAGAHEVQTYHGKVAEAEFRAWLGGFLPKRFAVTAGYVISQGLPGDRRAPHFDVIIYDQVESPILWIEDNADVSHHGRSLAIPAEYVYAVLEVKARLTGTSAKEAIEHLGDLRPLMATIDEPVERYPRYLPQQFCCGVVFFELMDKDATPAGFLNRFATAAQELRGLFGAIILRAEGRPHPETGRILLLAPQEPVRAAPEGTGAPTHSDSTGSDPNEARRGRFSAALFWAKFGFPQFAFDLLAMMKGTYEPGRLSSFHVIG